jgi:hypothetical protein
VLFSTNISGEFKDLTEELSQYIQSLQLDISISIFVDEKADKEAEGL